jgi:sterol desaturase/sphingolipid hydroxylase (fatty acid hydroxylase superfamily)
MIDWNLLAVTFVLPLVFLLVERAQHGPGYQWAHPGFLTGVVFGIFKLPIMLVVGPATAATLFWLFQSPLAFLNLGLLTGAPGWVQFVTYYLVFDLAFYIFHRAAHEVRVFWYFHAVHHSQTRLNPMAQLRGHPLEEPGLVAMQALAGVVLGGDPPFIFWFAFVDRLWSYFVHCDQKINLGPLKYVLVTPQYHRVHHSREQVHFDKNYAGRLILFDWLFGTLHPRFDEYPATGVATYTVTDPPPGAGPLAVMMAATRHMIYPFAAVWRYYLIRKDTHETSSSTG